MAATGRRAARDVLLLPAIHHDRDIDPAGDERGVPIPDQPDRTSRYGDGSRLSVVVRGARMRDLLALSRFAPGEELDHPASSRADCDPVRGVFRKWIPFSRCQQPVFVASPESSRRILGYIQSRVVGPDQRWLVQSIGTNTGVYDPEPIVTEMVRHVVQSAGLDGVKRIYARVEPDSALKPSLRESGFSPYSRERIMVASSVPEMASAPGVRVQEQADVWSIHQLYIQTTPREVQYAEALTSHSWEVDAIMRSSGHGCCGWLVTDGYLATGYIRAISRRDAHIVDFMISPEHRDLFPHLVATAFRYLVSLPSRRTWFVVRDYQSEFIPFLYELGFGIERAQEAHVRYTTAPVRSSVVQGVQSAVNPAKDPAARRVPTFFHGPIDTFCPAKEGEVPGEWLHRSCGSNDHGT